MKNKWNSFTMKCKRCTQKNVIENVIIMKIGNKKCLYKEIYNNQRTNEDYQFFLFVSCINMIPKCRFRGLTFHTINEFHIYKSSEKFHEYRWFFFRCWMFSQNSWKKSNKSFNPNPFVELLLFAFCTLFHSCFTKLMQQFLPTFSLHVPIFFKNETKLHLICILFHFLTFDVKIFEIHSLFR